MARKTSMFLVGLFVIMGTVIGVVFIVWIGATKYFEKGQIYLTYFDESVQGLQVDSDVKYRGVDVGRVLKIGVAPDNRLVQATMKIKMPGIIASDTVARLKSSGITGLVFIELDRREGKEPILGPKLDFETDNPVIPSRASDIKQIMAGFVEIYDKIKVIDFGSIAGQYKKTAKSVDDFFNGAALSGTMQNIETTTASMDRATKKIDAILAEGKVDGVLTEAKQGLLETRQLIGTFRNEIAAMKLKETAQKTDRLVTNLDRRTQLIAGSMDETLRGIRENSDNLNRILDHLSRNPSELLFGIPAPGNERKER
ncbi:MAG: phospholipid/cholesterol/gamma-HCH transport system substrate-binding protein [Thermodesulfobacteriota bacterium]|nr:phospholipid/cholesterol/gamma-HCH transport system substrate-binding protein [Thermodesulfobacteriota bacterium]